MRDYHNIQAWKLAKELTVAVYKSTKGFPSNEQYGLVSQMRRAAVSVGANIVEGSSRNSKREYAQFLYVARGSLAELGYMMELSFELNFLTGGQFKMLIDLQKKTASTLYGLIRAIEAELQ